MARLLEMRGIVKCFGPVKALDGVDIQLNKGEVLSLCGENGSGKSTLMKVLCGIYPAGDFEGKILFENKEVNARSIKDTENLGIAIIHQELTLVKELSIMENLFLGSEISWKGILNFSAMHHKTTEMLKRVKLDISPETKVGDLGVGQQQLVEIAKALSKKAKVLILDEPSAPLTESETAILLDLVRELRDGGVSCIYISHKLGEVKAISNHICVIRDGVHIDTRPAETMTTDDIITMMVGREMKQLFPWEEHEIGETVLTAGPFDAWDIANPNRKKVKNAALSLRRGEILGISGLVGSGRTELMECIYGCYRGKSTGSITLEGETLAIRSAKDALGHGIAMVPEDRKKNGIVPIMSVGQNISLAYLKQFSQHGTIRSAQEISVVRESIKSLKVKTPGPDIAIRNLSGGNQQKAILARFLLSTPKVLILDEPTRGIDVGAKYEIYKLMFQLVKKGISIIMVSSELPEVLGISDRVLVMHEGEIKGDLLNSNLTQEQIMDCALSEGIAS
ncbi:xylose ABC transporter ATP-binding protein [Pseudovibrio sp. Tun.PSC04-5.I4]|uniref:xylose ABC transporter ATP-binding protein n=1 Tax=Pseudovibrio sp. Tun.PSC04-5.I4 TaxID=1798213 RepID=UPI000884E522|nr:xylose ABC transporter ATP-binding protein [Pseudovibrio sp. Tun.PSC04-5.I4]SDR22607.1 xylose ABC transporter ATP-binding protein [Pseudovibrio sp. Tun.PSC04-5.I4]